MNLKKCKKCNFYTLNEICPKCKEKTDDAHYKFLRIKMFEGKRRSEKYISEDN